MYNIYKKAKKIKIKHLSKLDLTDNSMLVFQFNTENSNMQDIHDFAKGLQEQFPFLVNKCLFITEDVEISIIENKIKEQI